VQALQEASEPPGQEPQLVLPKAAGLLLHWISSRAVQTQPLLRDDSVHHSKKRKETMRNSTNPRELVIKILGGEKNRLQESSNQPLLANEPQLKS